MRVEERKKKRKRELFIVENMIADLFHSCNEFQEFVAVCLNIRLESNQPDMMKLDKIDLQRIYRIFTN